jgi:serine/threonine protein phosphatase 1
VPKGFQPVQRFERNTAGRDFVVGDIHGYFRKLQTQLDEMGFNPDVDRLFSVGDLVDRGPDSEMFEEWMAKPWFHAVRGNHENMAIDAACGLGRGDHLVHGGMWLQDMPPSHRMYVATQLDQLPYAIEVKVGDGKVGIIHADVFGCDWDHTISHLHLQHYQLQVTWSRERLRAKDDTIVRGVDALYVGHTIVDAPVKLGNTYWIDTGVTVGGALTILELTPGKVLA